MDGRAPLPLNFSPTSTFFTQQALLAGIRRPEDLDSRAREDLRQAIRLELQKERVRQNIIAAEIARRLAAAEFDRRRAEELRRLNYENNFQFVPPPSNAAAYCYPPYSKRRRTVGRVRSRGVGLIGCCNPKQRDLVWKFG